MALFTVFHVLWSLGLLFSLFHVASACTPAYTNRCRSGNVSERTMKCSDRGYSCNISDLNQDGEVLGGEKVTTLQGSCEISIIPDKYGSGVSACILRVSGSVSRTTGLSVSSSGEVSFTQAVSSDGDAQREFRYNCAAWCGDVKETNCHSRDCSKDAKWQTNTYQRCYGASTCSVSKCISKRTTFGGLLGCRSSDLWYGYTGTCPNLCDE